MLLPNSTVTSSVNSMEGGLRRETHNGDSPVASPASSSQTVEALPRETLFGGFFGGSPVSSLVSSSTEGGLRRETYNGDSPVVCTV